MSVCRIDDLPSRPPAFFLQKGGVNQEHPSRWCRAPTSRASCPVPRSGAIARPPLISSPRPSCPTAASPIGSAARPTGTSSSWRMPTTLSKRRSKASSNASFALIKKQGCDLKARPTTTTPRRSSRHTQSSPQGTALLQEPPTKTPSAKRSFGATTPSPRKPPLPSAAKSKSATTPRCSASKGAPGAAVAPRLASDVADRPTHPRASASPRDERFAAHERFFAHGLARRVPRPLSPTAASARHAAAAQPVSEPSSLGRRALRKMVPQRQRWPHRPTGRPPVLPGAGATGQGGARDAWVRAERNDAERTLGAMVRESMQTHGLTMITLEDQRRVCLVAGTDRRRAIQRGGRPGPRRRRRRGARGRLR